MDKNVNIANSQEDEVASSEAEDEKDKDYVDKETSDIDEPDEKSNKKYKCTEPGCNARFLRPSRLTWHLRKHNDDRPYKCSIEGCSRAYTNSSHLKRHENSHKPVTKVYECPDCLLEVGSLFSLKRHRKMIHDPKRLTCEQCGAKFRKKHCYAEHLSMHAGVPMYKCDVCKSDYPTLRLLKKHQLSHKTKNYPCKSTGCDKVFDKWSKLGKHMEEEHQFGHHCDKCEKRFKSKKQLKIHMAVHGGTEGPFLSCPYENCPKFYLHRRNLDVHVETFHLGRKYYCDHCKNGFTSKTALIQHLRVIHESVPVKENRQLKKPRRRRKDAGIPKASVAVKLTGLKLPYKLEKQIVHREPKILLKELDETTERLSDKSGEIVAFDLRSEKFVNLKRQVELRALPCYPVTREKEEKEEEKLASSLEEKDSKHLLDTQVADGIDQDLINDRNEPLEFSNQDKYSHMNRLDILESSLKEMEDTSEQVEMELSLLASELLSEESTTIGKLLEKCLDETKLLE